MFSESSPCLLGQHGSCSTAKQPGELSEKKKTKPTEQVAAPPGSLLAFCTRNLRACAKAGVFALTEYISAFACSWPDYYFRAKGTAEWVPPLLVHRQLQHGSRHVPRSQALALRSRDRGIDLPRSRGTGIHFSRGIKNVALNFITMWNFTQDATNILGYWECQSGAH